MDVEISQLAREKLRGFGELNPPYGVWDWDLQGNVIYADEKAARIFCVDPILAKKGLPPEIYFQSIHQDDRQLIIDNSMRSIATLGSCADDFRIVSGTGLKWVHSQGRCFAGEKDKAKCFVGLVAQLSQSFDPNRGSRSQKSSSESKDDILYLSLYARRIANQANQPFVAYLLDMVIAEVTDLRSLKPC